MFITSGATVFAVCFALSIICFVCYLWVMPDIDFYKALKHTKKEKFFITLSNILYTCSIWFAIISFSGILLLVASMVL